jgi:hypothetical protein
LRIVDLAKLESVTELGNAGRWSFKEVKGLWGNTNRLSGN